LRHERGRKLSDADNAKIACKGGSMKRVGLALVCASILAASIFAGTVAAGHNIATYTFYDCTGPAPSTFTATKTLLPDAAVYPVASASAFFLTDGSGLFIVLSFSPGDPPGISVSGAATVTCQIDFSIGTFTWSGILVP
jgi:hypothetical protein